MVKTDVSILHTNLHAPYEDNIKRANNDIDIEQQKKRKLLHYEVPPSEIEGAAKVVQFLLL